MKRELPYRASFPMGYTLLGLMFPCNAGWRPDYEHENPETFSSGTAAGSAVRKGWAIPAQALLIYMRFRY